MSNVFPRNCKVSQRLAVKGDGVYIVDSTGKRYLDGSGGAAVSCLGHGDAEITAARNRALFDLPPKPGGADGKAPPQTDAPAPKDKPAEVQTFPAMPEMPAR